MKARGVGDLRRDDCLSPNERDARPNLNGDHGRPRPPSLNRTSPVRCNVQTETGPMRGCREHDVSIRDNGQLPADMGDDRPPRRCTGRHETVLARHDASRDKRFELRAIAPDARAGPHTEAGRAVQLQTAARRSRARISGKTRDVTAAGAREVVQRNVRKEAATPLHIDAECRTDVSARSLVVVTRHPQPEARRGVHGRHLGVHRRGKDGHGNQRGRIQHGCEWDHSSRRYHG